MRQSPLTIGLVLLLLAPPAWCSTMHKEKRFGEPRADKALVYVVREKAFVGGGVGMFVFADEQLIAFVRNGTYGFGYVDPGSRLIWGDAPAGLELTLIAGETYYLAARATSPIILLSETEGKASIEKVASYIENDQTDVDNGAKKVAKRFEKAQKREASKVKAEVEKVAVAEIGQSEGTVTLPANTRVAIELMENLSSSLSRMGETVWFRVAEDVSVEGQIVVPRGTPVKATIRQVKAGSSFGAQGTIDVALVSADLDGGPRVPLIGQVAAAGDDRAAGVMTGILVGAFIKGTEAFHMSGTRYAGWTGDAIRLRAVPIAASAPAAHDTILATPHEIEFGSNTRRNPQPVELAFPCNSEASAVEVSAAGDWLIPEPIKAIAVSRKAETCTARFGGWELVRHIRPGLEAQILHLDVQSPQGPRHLEVPVRVRLE